jgi:DNA-binding MarR family transcriptional regulator
LRLILITVCETGKYVNMADVISKPTDTVSLIELLFFAYRDFISDPDAILDEFGFGRAHHRVLHFIGRDPGMTVAQLLDILRITKQSLGRVLRDLIEQGFVFQREGEEDRRQRLLFLTPTGKQLHGRLMAPQEERIRRAIAETQPGAQHNYRDVLFHLISPENREAVRDWMGRANVIGE